MSTRHVIIGNGIAGTTAARHLRMRDPGARITMISSESPHFFARTALMYVFMGHLTLQETRPYPDDFWTRNRIRCLHEHVERIDTDARAVWLGSGERLAYDRLLLATGSRPNRIGWPGEHLEGVQGLYHLGDLQRMESNTAGIDRAVVVGGGLIGVEMAEMLRSRGIEVTFLVRERAYMDYVLPPEESTLVADRIRAHGVDLRLDTEVERLESDAHGRVCGVRTTGGSVVSCQWVGLAVGVRPNIDLARDTVLETDAGFLVDDGLQTNIPGVFAAGDCAQLRSPVPGRPAVEPLWYTGRAQGAVVAAAMGGLSVRYAPGVFYNSAKFFDVEYATYGVVPPDGAASATWSDGRRMLRIAFDPEDRRVIGIHGFGVRLRAETCIGWIRDGETVDAVVRDLRRAGFDPEFSRPVGVPMPAAEATA